VISRNPEHTVHHSISELSVTDLTASDAANGTICITIISGDEMFTRGVLCVRVCVCVWTGKGNGE